jgi:hypothetical protein
LNIFNEKNMPSKNKTVSASEPYHADKVPLANINTASANDPHLVN